MRRVVFSAFPDVRDSENLTPMISQKIAPMISWIKKQISLVDLICSLPPECNLRAFFSIGAKEDISTSVSQPLKNGNIFILHKDDCVH